MLRIYFVVSFQRHLTYSSRENLGFVVVVVVAVEGSLAWALSLFFLVLDFLVLLLFFLSGSRVERCIRDER